MQQQKKNNKKKEKKHQSGVVPAAERVPKRSNLFGEPSLAVRIEERVHQVVAVVFGYLERLRFDAVVQALCADKKKKKKEKKN